MASLRSTVANGQLTDAPPAFRQWMPAAPRMNEACSRRNALLTAPVRQASVALPSQVSPSKASGRDTSSTSSWDDPGRSAVTGGSHAPGPRSRLAAWARNLEQIPSRQALGGEQLTAYRHPTGNAHGSGLGRCIAQLQWVPAKLGLPRRLTGLCRGIGTDGEGFVSKESLLRRRRFFRHFRMLMRTMRAFSLLSPVR